MSRIAHSIQASAPSMIGAPVRFPGNQLTPANLSPPETAKAWHRSCWPAVRTLTQKCPARCSRGQVVDVRDGLMATRGGSSDTEKNDWHDMPVGPSDVIADR